MNWLAHLLLSEPTPACRLGGILPDIASSAALADLPAEFQRGIHRHHRIDAYTDSHAIFRRSVQRFKPPLRRFGGILVDVFYDHFLARDWQSFSNTPLSMFTAEVYASFESHRADIPAGAFPVLQRMHAGDWLSSYRDVGGIASTLGRISARFRRQVDLVPAVSVLEQNYESIHADFAAFFPELCAYVRLGCPWPVQGKLVGS